MMRTLLLFVAVGVSSLLAPPAHDGPSLQGASPVDSVPTAPRSGHVDTIHGMPVPDPYRWLEDLDSPSTLRWVRAEDARARDFAARFPRRDALHDEIARLADVRRIMPPWKRGERYFYLSFLSSGGPGTPGTRLLVRDGRDGAERTLIDESDLPDGSTLARAMPGPNGRYVAYAISPVGSRWETLRLLEVETGRTLPVRLEGVRGGRSGIVWAPDGTGIFYERADLPAPGAERTAPVRNERVLFHPIAGAGDRDTLIYDPVSPVLDLTTSITQDGRYLLVAEREPASSGNRLVYTDLRRREPQFRALADDDDASVRFVGSRGSRVWLQTNRDAPNGKVVSVDLSAGPSSWRQVVPEMEQAINSWLGARLVGRHLVIGYLTDARTEWRVFGLRGEPEYTVQLPRLGSVWSGFRRTPDPDQSTTFYSLSGLTDPGSVYRLDLSTGQSHLFARPELGYDPEQFITRQVFYPSADSTRIPMYLVHRRGLTEDGPVPVVMYGYGFGGWSAAPWFQPHLAAWLRMGGAWTLPNIRGGGEYGDEWRRAGSGRNKQTGIDDYLAAAEWLVEQGISAPGLLVLNASSAGGAVGGGALVQRPELFGAAILDYPVLDLLRYDRFTGGQRWRSEFGTAEDPGDFRALLSYSPYHNVRVNRCYPATLLAPGERDEVTPPLHAYKFTAALQYAQSCPSPILLRVTWGAGHSSGATTADAVDSWTDQLSFLVRSLAPRGWEPRRAF